MISRLSNSVNQTHQVLHHKSLAIDTNNDLGFDIEELESFASQQSDRLGSSTFDADEVMSTYDTNQDGIISGDEKALLKTKNGLNMPSPRDHQARMMASGKGRPPMSKPKEQEQNLQTIESSEALTALLEALEKDQTDNDSDTTKALSEYLKQSTYNNSEVSNNSFMNIMI